MKTNKQTNKKKTINKKKYIMMIRPLSEMSFVRFISPPSSLQVTGDKSRQHLRQPTFFSGSPYSIDNK